MKVQKISYKKKETWVPSHYVLIDVLPMDTWGWGLYFKE